MFKFYLSIAQMRVVDQSSANKIEYLFGPVVYPIYY